MSLSSHYKRIKNLIEAFFNEGEFYLLYAINNDFTMSKARIIRDRFRKKKYKTKITKHPALLIEFEPQI